MSEGWAHENEFVTIISEDEAGCGVGVWDKEDGAEVVEFDEDGELSDGVPLFSDDEIKTTIGALEDALEDSDPTGEIPHITEISREDYPDHDYVRTDTSTYSVRTEDGNVFLTSLTDSDGELVTDGGRTSAPLTETQLNTLEMAFEHGYFEVPREVSLRELGEELDCSHQTISERLRRATKMLTMAALAVDPEMETRLWASSRLTKASRVHNHPLCRKLVSTGANPKPIDRAAVDWHDLEPCPYCEITRSIDVSVVDHTVPGGAD